MNTILLTIPNQISSLSLLDGLMLALSISAMGIFIGVGVSLTVGNERRVGMAILMALTLSLIWTVVFQIFSFRPRPDETHLAWITLYFPSYPSGHAAAAFATGIILVLTYWKKWWLSLVVIGVCLVAVSRVYLGYHSLDDILGGAILGSAVGTACYGFMVEQNRSQPRWRWLLWPQAALAALITHMAYLDILPLYLLRWPLADKVLHFVLFGAVVFWFNIWLKGKTIQIRGLSIPLALIIPFTIALTEEGMQALSPVRSSDIVDLTCDLAGMLFFWWLSQKIINNYQLPTTN